MWRGMEPHGKARVEAVRRTDGKLRVESSREPFMSPSGHDPCENLGGGGSMGNNILSVGLLQGERRN